MNRLLALAVVAGLALAGPALADDSDEAKEHFFKGKELVEEGALENAVVEFKKSYELNPIPVVLFNIAVCYDDMHEYAEAMKYYQKFLEVADEISPERQAQVDERVAKIEKYIGTLILVAPEDGLEIFVDDKYVGKTPEKEIFVVTGEHDLVVRKSGTGEYKQHFTIVSGDTKTIEIPEDTFAEPDDGGGGTGPVEPPDGGGTGTPPPDDGKKKLGKGPFIATASVGGALLIGSIITGAMALGAKSDFEGMYYEDDWKSTKDRAETLALVTDIMIGVGSAAAVAAIVLVFFTDFRKEKPPSDVALSPLVGPDSAGLVLDLKF